MSKTMSRLDSKLISDIAKAIDDIVSGNADEYIIRERLREIELAFCDAHAFPQYGVYIGNALQTAPVLKDSYEKYMEWMENRFKNIESEIPSSVAYITVLYLDYYYTPYSLLPSYGCGPYAEVKDLEGNTYILKADKSGKQGEIEEELLNEGFQFVRETSDKRLIYWRKR